jgi:magnesium chelatase family protein
LFLDELPEFDRRVLEVLREPMESGRILISRAARQAEFPARFQLVAAMNPCPCGYSGDPSGRCRCTADAVARYRGRISGPMLDRIDMHVEVPRVPPAQWREPGEDSATVRARVLQARAMQQARAGKPNALLGTLELARDAALSQADRVLLDSAAERLGLSARAHQRILRVSRSIADLAGSHIVHREHLTEAIGYRRLDRLPMAAVG